ncbi:MAG: hypothetical protein H7838_13390, partial [Magnetococcus sp. DMHC-8]
DFAVAVDFNKKTKPVLLRRPQHAPQAIWRICHGLYLSHGANLFDKYRDLWRQAACLRRMLGALRVTQKPRHASLEIAPKGNSKVPGL